MKQEERERERETKGQTGIKWMRAHAPVCRAAIVLASGSMLIPTGQTASLMDTETIDLYSITGTLGIRLPGTHTHTQMYRYLHTVRKKTKNTGHVRTFIYFTYTVYLWIQPHTSVQRKIKRRKKNAPCRQSMHSLELKTHARDQ